MSKVYSITRDDPLNSFYKCEIKYNERVWPSTEHLYHGLKFEGNEKAGWYSDLIAHSNSPFDARLLGNMRKCTQKAPHLDKSIDRAVGQGIESRKGVVELMRKAVTKRLEQSEEFRKALEETKDSILILNVYDPFWGLTARGGKNVYGNLLMEVRSKIK